MNTGETAHLAWLNRAVRWIEQGSSVRYVGAWTLMLGALLVSDVISIIVRPSDLSPFNWVVFAVLVVMVPLHVLSFWRDALAPAGRPRVLAAVLAGTIVFGGALSWFAPKAVTMLAGNETSDRTPPPSLETGTGWIVMVMALLVYLGFFVVVYFVSKFAATLIMKLARRIANNTNFEEEYVAIAAENMKRALLDAEYAASKLEAKRERLLEQTAPTTV
ncbi:hypothetical protein ACFVAJ_17360 [Agromyces sp. NPDC057679]|uniref:hypothetical protein n=1 Tax=Agromyces sp. NPDC057679 TaxID=3346207 RepID=UPI00366FADBA